MINFKTFRWKIILLLFSLIFISSSQKKMEQNNLAASIKIKFNYTVKENKIVLNDSVYSNPFQERYTITKLRYYITHVSLTGALNIFKERNSYHLLIKAWQSRKA
ncbi:MAG: hypothetical protein M3Z56_05920 [Bacteroidota bacterium]|nr:hypothetical protein [Bacteroidota bacterium]